MQFVLRTAFACATFYLNIQAEIEGTELKMPRLTMGMTIVNKVRNEYTRETAGCGNNWSDAEIV